MKNKLYNKYINIYKYFIIKTLDYFMKSIKLFIPLLS